MPAKDLVAAFAALFIWSANFSVGKIGLSELPPLLLMAVRFSVLAVVLLPFLRRPAGTSLFHLVSVGFWLGGAHFGLVFLGLRGVDAGTAAITLQLAVPFSALLAWIFFREKVTTAQIAGMAIAFLGVWILAGSPRLEGSRTALLIVVAAAFAWVLANVHVKRLGPINPFVLNAWVAAVATPVQWGATLAFEEDHWALLAATGWRGWGAIAYMAVFASIVAYGLWYHLIEKHPVNRVIPLTMLIPGLTIAIAAVALGEPVTWQKVGGGLLTIAGVAMIQLLGRRPQPA